MHSVLITGANRGIGFGFVQQLTSRAEVIFACCRNPGTAQELKQHADKHSNVKIIELDPGNGESINKGFLEVSSMLGEKGLTCLINNAGVMNKGSGGIEKMADEESCRNLFNVNCVGPALMCKVFVPLVKKAALDSNEKVLSVNRAAIFNVSSGFGSIGEAGYTVHYEYRMSKAGLNMLSKLLSVELKEEKILVASLSPGWVSTGIGGTTASLTVEQSVSQLIAVIDKMDEKNNGQMTNFDGRIFAH